MKMKLIAIVKWLATQLNFMAAKLERSSTLGSSQSKFVDLAPTEEADQQGVYAEALKFATNNPNVSNIALTGPYGSGKSSIIRSFLKNYGRPALHISLAAFLPEAEDKRRSVTKQEIERSILQQLLYGADADKLPLSRFKRIQSPGFWAVLKSLYILLGLTALLHLFQERADIFAGSYFKPFDLRNWLDLSIFALAGAFLWSAIHFIYVASFGVSLKSISLKNIELGLSTIDQDSILNRHLDEIVYFFQSTSYDLVVVEDLDRFEDSDIFVTLREINSLVNGNVGVKRRIRFLYALRDDMFVNTDRTKFFEFIVPVIPIINSSNSIDMVLEQGERLELVERLDRQFLREVSRYLDDLRLIHNIFNEYAIYVANLETDGENILDTNKLLAVLIYKNVYPRDFERLHRGQGHLAAILGRKETFIAEKENSCRNEIAKLEQGIEDAELQIPRDLKELRRIYAMAAIEKLPLPVRDVSLDNQTWIGLAQLVDHDALEQIIAGGRIFYRDLRGGAYQHSLPDVQSEVHETLSYKQRAHAIKKKSDDYKATARRRIGDLRDKIKEVRTSKFNVLLRTSSENIEHFFRELGNDGELARFLLLEGYLDDSYYQYTSLFHSGRLSPNDNKFLIQIRAFTTPDPDFPIDNPKEVIEGMRDDDFSVSYTLNVKLVDTLLEDQERQDRLEKLFKLLSTEFSEHQEFFDAYYAAGTRVADLLLGLSRSWPQFVSTIVESPGSAAHVAHLLEGLPASQLASLGENNPELRQYVSGHLPEVLSLTKGLDPAKLEPLGIEADDLRAIDEHSGVVRTLFEHGHYRLTVANLNYILEKLLGQQDEEGLRIHHYTTLRRAGNDVLIRRVEAAFETYFEGVLLKLDENCEEDVAAILSVMSFDELDTERVEGFVSQQVATLPSLNEVPARYQAGLFRMAKVEASWANCLDFLRAETFDTDSLVDFLNDADVRSELLSSPMPDGKVDLPLRKFIIEANGLEDGAYREYVRALPSKFSEFPTDLDAAKLHILVEEQRVTFNSNNLTALSDNADLQVAFVAMNISAYLSDPHAIAVDDEFRQELLEEALSDEEKCAIIRLMDLTALQNLPDRAAIVGTIYARANAELISITSEAARAMILNTRPVDTQILLLNKFQETLSDAEVREILPLLPRPYNEITTGWARPRLMPTDANRELVEWLDRRDIISSFGEAIWSDDIVVYLYHK
jgi:hypothetical protein